MDSLTHIVLGAAIGHQLLSNQIGKRALLYGAIIGSLPDIDILFGKFTDPITAIEIHRGFTHSVFIFLIITPLIAWLINKIEFKNNLSFLKINIFVFLVLFTHSFLDVLTTWGTQMFWPIPSKLAVQSIFVADPMFTLPILFGLLFSIFKKSLKPNQLGLMFGALYLVWGIGAKYFTLNQFEKALIEQNIEYQHIQNKPSPLNSILWSANVMTEEGFYIGYYSLLDTKPIEFLYFPKNHALVTEPLEKSKDFNRLVSISEGWFTLSQKNNQNYFNDLRFGMIGLSQESDFVFSYEIQRTANGFEFSEKPKNMTDTKLVLKQLFKRINGN